MSIRVLVAGPWGYSDREAAFAMLDGLNRSQPIEVVIETGERGAAQLAASWARVREVSSWRVPIRPADGADYVALRNRRALAMCRPDVVLALGDDKETADLVDQARAAGVRVMTPAEAVADPRQISIFERLEA